MGREWHYWGRGGGKTSKKGGAGGGVGGGVGGREGEKDSANIPTGCMCAVFQLFDLHQFQFPLNHHHQQQHHPSTSFHQSNSNFLPLEEPPITKGVEAPRNSLELEEPDSLSSSKDEDFIMPMSIQIKTKNGGDKGPSIDISSSSEISSSSPGAKTPNLVARLMGLDLLPDHLTYSSSTHSCSSPNPHSKSNLHQQNSCRPRQQSLQTRTYSHRSCLDVTDHASGTRSLPETPRISSARRSDVEHRLSLQINKENITEEVLLPRISSLKRKDPKVEEESRSPGHYARQIVKQVKESVIGRKVGLDITNTVRNREQLQGRRDQQLQVFGHQPFKYSKKMISKNSSTTKVVDVISSNSPAGTIATTSCSPRLKFSETQNKPVADIVPCKDHINISTYSQVNILPQNTKPSTKPNVPPLQDNYQHHRHHQHHHWQQKQQQRPIKECKKVTEEKFAGPVVPPPAPRLIKRPPKTSDIMIRNRHEETFVRPATTNNIPDKKCSKRTPSSNDHHHLNISASTLLPVKKVPTPPATKIPQKQVSNAQESKRSSQLPSCSSQSYKSHTTQTLDARDKNKNKNNNEDNGDMSDNGVVTTNITTGEVAAAQAAAECEYITRMLRRTGIDKDTPVSFTRWFSPSHPLDPSIFYYLEHFTTISSVTPCENYTSSLDHRCNRKLLFHLVDEILADILRPYINIKPWVGSNLIGQRDRISQMKGSHLVQLLCAKLTSFPCADCRDLEDIDGLIDKDLPPSQMKDQIEVAFGEEGEGIVTEIEKDVVDTLIHETAALILYGGD